LGYGGQYLVLVPDQDLIMVATSGLRPMDFFIPEDLLNNYILPASLSNVPLPANPAGMVMMEQRLAALADSGKADPLPSLPETAWTVSERVYFLDPSPVGWQTVALAFRPGYPDAVFSADGVEYNVGLDGMHRTSDPPPGLAVPRESVRLMRGSWTGGDTFVIELLLLGRPDRYTETFQFQGEELVLTEDVYLSGNRYVTRGNAQLRKSSRRR